MVTRVGIIGLGYWGTELLKYFRETEGVQVVAAQDLNPNKINTVNLNGANFYPDMETMFDQDPMDAVVISTPPTEHLQPTVLAASRGIHVFCEKPIAASLADCDAMIDVCKKNNVRLMVAFKHRFAKAFSYVKSRSKDLGKPLWGMYTYPLWKVDDPGWKFLEEGTRGIVVENMVHAFDGLRYLFGDVQRIYAEGDNFIFKNVSPPDSAIVVLRFKNGAIGAVGGGCTSDERISREYLDVHFEKGVAQIYGMLDQPIHLRFLLREGEKVEEFVFEGSDGVREEVSHFVDCIQNDKDLISDGLDGRKALEIALTAIQSLRENGVIDMM